MKARARARMNAERCHWCRWPVVHPEHPHPWPFDAATVDHLKPRCSGGTNDAANLVTACLSCNQARGCKPAHEWAEWLKGDGARWSFEHPSTRGKVPRAVRGTHTNRRGARARAC